MSTPGVWPAGANSPVGSASPLEAEMAASELATIRISLDKAGIPDRRVGAVVRVAEALGYLDQVRHLVAKYREKSAEYLEDWQDWDSHDGHERCGQGIAYSDVADELEALLGEPS